MHRIKLIHYTARVYILSALVALCFSAVAYFVLNNASAATSGKMVLYFHSEPSDADSQWNAMTFSPPDYQTDNPNTTLNSTLTNATPPTQMCQSGANSLEEINQLGSPASAVGEQCMVTFISSPVGQSIAMSTSDTSAITGQLWSSESASNITAAMNVYIYRWVPGTSTLSSSDRIATLTCADPGTSATSCVPTAVAPANNITFAATDRIVAIVTMNVTGARSNSTVYVYYDSSARAASQITLKYTSITPNKPTLVGSMDDDFTSASGTTTCSTSGVIYNTKWRCLQGGAASTAGAFNAEDAAASGSGDSSGWLWLKNSTSATSATVSNFGTTPSNTFMYQTMPNAYGNGTIRTVLNSTTQYESSAGNSFPSSPYNHCGLVLWTSNTDYLELEVYSTGDHNSTGTVFVNLNNSGTLQASPISLNPSTTSGIYNRVWLGFVNTNGSWQAQYSTDGATWNNVGNPVSHSLFTRTGLNAFTSLANPIGSYSGAFEWFQSTLAAPTYSQMSYQWFANADSTVPGSPFGTMNTPYTLTSAGQQFRLRYLLKETGQTAAGGDSFALQYSPLGAAPNCSSISNSSWGTLDPSGLNWYESSASAGWTTNSNKISALSFNNKLWAIAGVTNINLSNQIWSSSDGISWTQASNAPWSSRTGLAAAVFNNKIWVMGGQDYSTSTYLNDVWYSSDGTNWTQAANASWTGRTAAAITVFNNKLWIMGGTAGAEKNDVWSFDGTTWSQATAGASWTARYAASAVSFNSKLWIMGGNNSSSGSFNDVWSSSDGATWTSSTAAWTKRYNLGAVVYNSKIWVLGGFDVGGSSSSVWYSSDGSTWTQANNMSLGNRDGLGAVVYNSKIWVLGGQNLGSVSSDVWYAAPPVINYYNNPTPASGANISSTANDPTDSTQSVNPQSYQEADNFSNSQSAMGGTIDGLWDLSLYDNGAPSGTTYCFRITKSDGTALSTYANYPMITTYSPGPTLDQVMRGGTWFNSSGVKQDKFWAH